MERWDGQRWSIQHAPNPHKVSFLGVSCTSESACTAVGGYVAGTPTHRTTAETWNGAKWSLQPTPDVGKNGELQAVSCTSTDACTALGDYQAGKDTRTFT